MVEHIKIAYKLNDGTIKSIYDLPFTFEDKVLEVGCGDKPLAHNPLWHTMDYRKSDMVDIVGDLEQPWPIAEATYNGVYGTFVIEHMTWRKVPHFISECFRVLKPGGKVYMVGPNTLEQCKEIARKGYITDTEAALLFGGQDEGGWNAHKAAFSPDSAIQAFAKAGFENITVTEYIGAPTDMVIQGEKPKGANVNESLRLNLGSFKDMFHGWMNLDILDLKVWAASNGYPFTQMDVTKGMPFPENTIGAIYTSHLLEHITRVEAGALLADCYRVLKPGGKIRVAVPDLHIITAVYNEDMLKFSENEGVKNAEDSAEGFWNFLTAGHKTCYDSHAITAKLLKAGFDDVIFFQSNKMSPVFEGATDIHTDHSLYVEAVKPLKEVNKDVVAAVAEPGSVSRSAPVPTNIVAGNRPLNIGLLSTQFFGCPPKGYSGLEMVVWDLAQALAERGHKVRLFAPEGSQAPPNGELVITGPVKETVEQDWLALERDAYAITAKNIDGLDILHGHNWFGFEYALKDKIRVCHTHHGHIHGQYWTKPPYKLNFITLSKFMQAETKQLVGYESMIAYNGIEIEKYPYQEKKGDRLLFVGRLDEFKQPHVAIKIAKALGMELDICGGTFVQDKAYLEEIRKMCDGKQIKLYENAGPAIKVPLMQNARCLLFPSKMGEPFGLVAAEAMCCGTPVIALKDGAIKEVVQDGGFVCETEEDMIKAMDNLYQIDPGRCRYIVEHNFSRQKMAERYEYLYREILAGREW